MELRDKKSIRQTKIMAKPFHATDTRTQCGQHEDGVAKQRPSGPTEPGAHGQVKEQTWAGITKACRLLQPSQGLWLTGGWSPQITVEEGFRRTVEWHVQNRDWLRGIHL